MADVTISSLPLGTPSGNVRIPYSDGNTTFSTRPSAFVAASSGALLQVVSNTLDTVVGPFTNSDGECMRVTITPKSSTSKMYLTTNFNWGSDNPNGGFAIQKSANNGTTWTAVSKGNAAGTNIPARTVPGVFTYNDDYTPTSNVINNSYSILDDNNTTNPLIYRLYWYHLYQNGGSFYFNRAYLLAAGNPWVTCSSTITIQEIVA